MAIHHFLLEKSKAYLKSVQNYIATYKKTRPVIAEHTSLADDKEKTKETIIFEVSLMSAVKIIMVLLGIFLTWKFIDQTAHILESLFFAAFLAATLYPSVRFFERLSLPRPVAIAVVFVLLFSFIIFLFSTIIPALISQAIALGGWIIVNTKSVYMGDFSVLPVFLQHFGPALQELILQLDGYVQSLQTSSETQKGFLQMLTDNIDKIASWKDGLTSLLSAIMAFFANMLLVFIMVFFIILDREVIRSFFLSFFPFPFQKYLYIKSYQVQQKLSEWVHGQMLLFLFMGTTTWLFLSFMGVDYALAIGFISGLGEFLPFIGPPLTLLIALPLAFAQGVDVGIYTLIFFAVQQFIEGNILVPMIMEKAVGVTPIVTILAMLIGFQFLDILGAIMAIPMASIVGIFLEDFRSKKIFSLDHAQKTNHSVP